jgi:hypothetical protein
MSYQISPVYLDGPLQGREHPINRGASGFETIDPNTNKTHIYRFQKFGWPSGGTAIFIWLAWCSPYEPTAMAIAKALMKPELIEKLVSPPSPGTPGIL